MYRKVWLINNTILNMVCFSFVCFVFLFLLFVFKLKQFKAFPFLHFGDAQPSLVIHIFPFFGEAPKKFTQTVLESVTRSFALRWYHKICSPITWPFREQSKIQEGWWMCAQRESDPSAKQAIYIESESFTKKCSHCRKNSVSPQEERIQLNSAT